MSGAETARCPVVQRRIGGAQTAAPKWPSPRFLTCWEGGRPFRCWKTVRRAVSAPEISVPAPNFYLLFFSYEKNNNEAGNSLDAAEDKPVLTRVLNPNASEASYKPKQRSYRRNN